ncbi:MAG: DinB family protein [Bacteroidota bacterium]
MLSSELRSSEYNSYYHPYIKALGGEVLLMDQLVDGRDLFISFLNDIPSEKLAFSYAEGKWSLAEVLMHIIDAERVFQYRGFRFGRNDKTPLPGFEQDDYVPESNANQRSKREIAEEYRTVRNASIALFRSFSNETLQRIGIASGSEMSVRALGFVICGHQAHHLKIVRERYLG